MTAITVLMLVTGLEESAGHALGEDSPLSDVARLCMTPALQLGFTHPHRLEALVAVLLGMARATLRKCSTGGTILAHVRYLGNGAFQVNVEVQAEAGAIPAEAKESFSGGIVNLANDDMSWTRRSGVAPWGAWKTGN